MSRVSLLSNWRGGPPRPSWRERERERRPPAPECPTSNRRPCHFYLRTGTCKFGAACKFSHDIAQQDADAAQSSSQDNHDVPPRRPVDDRLREWRRLLKSSSHTARPHDASVTRFLELGLQLMDGDIGASQEAIKELASETGLGFIKAVTDWHIQELEAAHELAKLELWTTQISPLFRLITNPRLVNSNILEQEVSTIYSFLVGIDASRLASVFEFILSIAETWDSGYSTTVNSSLAAVLGLSLSVLSRAIGCRTSNIINDAFHSVVGRFRDIMTELDEQEDGYVMAQAVKHLDYLQRRLGFGRTFGDLRKARATTAVQETFKLRRDLPGDLSADGPRHDNDHVDIADIRIMPTYEEIVSPRSEYLPTTDPSQWHRPGISGRIDREFRLLREDTVGQLRDAAHSMFDIIRSSAHGHLRQPKNGVRMTAYTDAVARDIMIDANKGLEVMVRCRQPEVTYGMNDRARRDWWEQCRRLQAGALTCVLDAQGMIQFFVVAESTLRIEPAKSDKSRTADETKKVAGYTLSTDPSYLYVKLHLVDKSESAVSQLLCWYQKPKPAHLVEFPGVLLASFKHTLEALQDLSQKPDIPFAGIIAPENSGQGTMVDVLPPLFARAPGFVYDLTCLSQDGAEFTIRPQQPPPVEEISRVTGLDKAQATSLLNTLSREVSLIQGPPGTGKSYTGEKLIQGLLANRKKADLGPIICVCFTNHALDQLLEHLIDAGIQGIIRIGSRSKSERLEKLNLRVVSQGMDLTKAEKRGLYDSGKMMQDSQRHLTSLLASLTSVASKATVREHLYSRHNAHCHQLFQKEVDEAGFETVQSKAASRNPIEHWLKGNNDQVYRAHGETRDLDILFEENLFSMTRAERHKLYQNWLKEICDDLFEEILEAHRDHEDAKEQRDLIREEVRLRCLQQAQIIGVTTTGMARDLHLLRKLQSKIVVCEEAGEVLEAHSLTTLLPSVEQLILIGDHLQLRPQIQNFELQSTNPRGLQYSLDVSLFERLVQPPHVGDLRLPFSVLETQRRMHPSIAEMVRSTLYPTLKDAENVKEYPEVVGMQKRLFWLNHQRLEAGASAEDPNSTSHSNDFEVEMVTALVSHLLRQGTYNPEDIAVLTPYLGQLQKLRRKLANELTFAVDIGERDLDELDALDEEKVMIQRVDNHPIAKTTLLRSVRLATVDNFQGEEATILIISLVRSNPQNRCGFLNTSNRINVLMSRAKHGCYILGNSATYKGVPMWDQIMDLLQAGGNFGPALGLQCPRHRETPIRVSVPDHFAMFSPDGGCNLRCDRRLHCGHACYGPCHSDLLHKAVKCHEKCPRPKEGCDHGCPRECGEPCEQKCNVTLQDTWLLLPCGHVMQSPKCWQKQNPDSVQCQEVVDRKIPECGHVVKLRCSVDFEAPGFTCSATCNAALPCGHACRSPCHRCHTREEGKIVRTTHNACTQRCGRNFTTCSHTCPLRCHGDTSCGLCKAQCEVSCSHSRCSKPCHEPCAPCAEERCGSRCPHTSCTMPCAAPCNWVPCSKRCLLTLSCGHQCPSVCGEPCPGTEYCHECGSEDNLSRVVDLLLFTSYRDIDPDDDPCIFPGCLHFYTVTSMDGYMAMSTYYEVDADGKPVRINTPSLPFSLEEVKVCPDCRGSLRNISRYGRIVRRAMLDETTKKFIVWSNARYLQLAESLVQEQQALEQHRDRTFAANLDENSRIRLDYDMTNQVRILTKRVGKDRYLTLRKLYLDVRSFLGRVTAEEQPFQRVADLVRHVNRQNGTFSSFNFDEDLIQHRGMILAESLLLKCYLVILADFVTILGDRDVNVGQESIVVDLTSPLRHCQTLIALSVKTSRPEHTAEGHVYTAQLYGYAVHLRNRFGAELSTKMKVVDECKTIAANHIESARRLLAGKSWPSKPVMEADIEAAETMLRGETFYRRVSAEEFLAVYGAMAKEFSGTGHWYYCERGHPFTVGECGMPMELARCPECDAPVGGRHHAPAEGVRHATDIEEIAGGVRNMRI